MSRVVVTGATGHVGANLVRALAARGDRVVAFVRSGPTRSLQGVEIETVKGDVCDEGSLCAAFEGADVVYHAAALISLVGGQNGMVHHTNVEGTRFVTRAARKCGVKRLVYFCSVHAFEQAPLDQSIDETRRRVRSGLAPAYDRSKAAAEAEVRRAVEQGLDAVILHPSGVIGPTDFGPSRMGRFFLDLSHRSLPALVDGGFDFVDVRDVVDGAIAAAEKGRTGESYILSGSWTDMSTLARRCGELTGVRPPRFCSPMWLARVGAPFMDLWYLATKHEPLFTRESLTALRANRSFSHEKAARELGYAPRPLQETIGDIYRWFAEEGLLPPDVASRFALPNEPATRVQKRSA